MTGAAIAAEWDELVGWFAKNLTGGNREPLLVFLQTLAASEHARWMHPSQSMFSIGLSPVRAYSDRRKRAMVYVTFGGDTEQAWRIEYQEGQGCTVKSEQVGRPQSPEVMERIVAWLRREDVFAP